MVALLKSGGLLMIPILVCGIAATYIIIERCVYFASIKKRDQRMKENLGAALAYGYTSAAAFAVAAAFLRR